MLKKILDAIKGIFSNLFGGSKKSETPSKPVKPSPIEETPQDASEITPDTVVIVANEMEEIVILPNTPDQDFDEDIFDNEDTPVEVVEPVVVPEPVPETPVVVTPSPGTSSHNARYLWCLDNGHGSLTSGKRSPKFDDGVTQFMEYEFNRDIVSRVAKQLDKKGVKYFNVVPEIEIDNFLQGRVDRANNKSSDLPKIYLSIHSNAAPARSSNDWAADSISGIETWFYHGSKKGQKLASIFQKHLLEKTGLKNRHLKSRPESQFYVLRKTKMVSVLTENGFYNNKSECEKLINPEFRQKVADAHVAAIMEIEETGI
ncbi:MAG: hypothetical protein DHS20C18_30310 [Saprospiraceae bacterium]|nr:MAG: hypothetical protein DHS20C18_30310 [Saprospiraceae bacterium]